MGTVDWESLIDEGTLAGLLPAEYSHFSLPCKESLVVFLSRLPAEVQEQIFAEQLRLPFDASLSLRLGRMAHSCPVLQKLGQILARDQRIAPELRNELAKLESVPPSVSLEAIQSILVQELGPLEAKALFLLPPAIAEASVAVVIPFQDLSKPQQAEGVFKVLKPGIEDRLHLELDILSDVGLHLDSRLHELGIPPINYQDTFHQVRDKLRGELRLEEEQRHLQNAASFYAKQPEIQIPTLFDHCTRRITAMERVFGEKVTEHSFQLPAEKTHLANLVAKALIVRPILCPEPQALFHCDPHAGNLFSTHDGRLAILDWSLSGFLGAHERAALVQVMLAAVSLNPERIISTLLSLDLRGECNEPPLRACVHDWLKKMRNGHLPGLSWLVGLLDDAVQRSRLSMSSELLMFRKSLLTLSGVLSEIGAENFNLDRVLLFEFLRSSMLEWPSRWVSSPNSRDYATRISNLDITETLLSSPLIVGRYWQAALRDLIESRRGRNRSLTWLPATHVFLHNPFTFSTKIKGNLHDPS